jgi:membrane protease YdiL (CAAX protease family)
MIPCWSYGDLIFLFGLYIPLSLVLLPISKRLPGGVLTGQWIVYACWFAAAAALFWNRYQRPFLTAIGWRWTWRWAVGSIGAGFAATQAVQLVSRALKLPGTDSPVRALLEDPATLPLAAASIVLLGPAAEEIAFRGLAQPLLARSLGPAAGIALAAVPFALLHAPQLRYSLPNVALIAMAGIVFGWIRHASQSTAMPVLAHATYNGVLLLNFFVQGKHG